MKPAQWIGAIFVLAGTVFVATFALNYLGSSATPPSGASADPGLIDTGGQLQFPSKRFPGNGTAFVCEVKVPSTRDYWFFNEEKEVRVGLLHKTCKCTSVELYAVPAELQQLLLAPAAAARVAAAEAGGLGLLGLCLAQDGWATHQLEEKIKPAALERGDTAVVPARAVGWVRLNWKGEHPQAQVLTASLWMNRPDSPPATLEIQTMYVEPLRSQPVVEVGTLNYRELPKTVDLYCWSSTRTAFRLKAESAALRGQRESDPFVVGRPVLLSAAERDRLAADLSSDAPQPVRVLSGYRIPVTLRKVSEDGQRPFEIGPIHRWATLTSDDVESEPLQVSITGHVQGDVTVGTRNENAQVQFGIFDSSKGASRTVSLHSDVPGLQLELDTARKPDFLDVHFPSQPEVLASGHRIWRVQVKVLPNRASGTFPRRDDPRYRDSAFYVRSVEKVPRSIRVPVVGTANDR